jgi:hypothetical protein
MKIFSIKNEFESMLNYYYLIWKYNQLNIPINVEELFPMQQRNKRKQQERIKQNLNEIY